MQVSSAQVFIFKLTAEEALEINHRGGLGGSVSGFFRSRNLDHLNRPEGWRFVGVTHAVENDNHYLTITLERTGPSLKQDGLQPLKPE